MSLSTSSRPYKIPEYSLTGDLLSYIVCGLQYRYHNKGSLPPSTPVQLWFGEFIHSFMGEAFLRWKNSVELQNLPWAWIPTIREIEIEIHNRLSAKGLQPPPNLFCPFTEETKFQGFCRDKKHPHKLIASQRTEQAINTWGVHLFPLISESEVNLKGIRPMPNYREDVSRCNYYGVKGRIDVVTSVQIDRTKNDNRIIEFLLQNSEIKDNIANLGSREYEIIIDYKGMRRPSKVDSINKNLESQTWQAHEWQILTYAWLRSQMTEHRPIVAGILYYLNELAPSGVDIRELRYEVENKLTDLIPIGRDLEQIRNWRAGDSIPDLSKNFREKRSMRMIPINEGNILGSLEEFDNVVNEIEESVLNEIYGAPITNCWQTRPLERNCTACDFKTYCPNPSPRRYSPSTP